MNRSRLSRWAVLLFGAAVILAIAPQGRAQAQTSQRCFAETGFCIEGRIREFWEQNGGLPVVLSQTFRAIIHSRMKVGLSKYSSQYKHADVVLFEPSHADAEMFFANVFSYAERNKIAEHAYQRTRQELLNRADELQPIFEKHGIRMRMDVLRDRERHLAAGVKEALRDEDGKRDKSPMQRLDEALEDLERWVKAETGSQKNAA